MKSHETPPTNRGPSATSEQQSGRRERLREMLATLQSQQLQRMRAFRDRDQGVPGDEVDDAAREDDFELSTSLADIAAARRAAIEEALQRVEHGEYGLCEECGEEIAPARLHAIPTAVLCVDCQQAREARSKKIRSEGPFLWVTSENPAPPSSEMDTDGGQAENRPMTDSGPRRRGRPAGTARTLTGTKLAAGER
ncbi:MAG: TraR/DksA family transcriptional regulator [Candidatus Binataceae bacterium]